MTLLVRILLFTFFSKKETDEEAVDIRKNCEDSVVTINDLQNQILVVRTPHRRVNPELIRKNYHEILSFCYHRFHFIIKIYHLMQFRWVFLRLIGN